MKISINANMVDIHTQPISLELIPVFKKLSDSLEGEYGGDMENLLIYFELIESIAKENGQPLHAFRFQKRVSGRSYFGLPSRPDMYNVGHFSVRSDFVKIASIKGKALIYYSLSLLFYSTSVLLNKQKRLGGFDAVSFRSKFKDACEVLGYEVGLNKPL